MVFDKTVTVKVEFPDCDECGDGGNGLCPECKHEVMERFNNG